MWNCLIYPITGLLSLWFTLGTLELSGGVDSCGQEHNDRRLTVLESEAEEWIKYFTARYFQEQKDIPETKLDLENICYYFPFSGFHYIYPEKQEALYSFQVYVLIEKKIPLYVLIRCRQHKQ